MSVLRTGPVKTTCPYCGVGCGVLARRHGGTTGIAGDPSHPANFGSLCSKGSALGDTVGLDGRLLHPHIGGRQATWDEALTRVARAFSDTIERHGPDSVAFYVSGQLLTEDYYIANKLMKGFIGSANIDTNSRLCMASAVAGHRRAFGGDLVPGCYEDLTLADLIVLTGSNTAWCHPILFQRIVKEKERRPELKLVVIDPRRTATAEMADLHLPVRSGTDVWLFNGLLTWLRRHGATDTAFVSAHTNDASAALDIAEASAPDPQTRRAGLWDRSDPTRGVLSPVRGYRASRNRFLARGEPVFLRHRQGEQYYQLPPADRAVGTPWNGAVFADRPTQRHGRARSRRYGQHAGRAYGPR